MARRVSRTGNIGWKESFGFGERWIVEIYFSGPNRTTRHVINAIRPDYIT
ncbi:MAG: hypothetical protein M1306_02975 [Candidatus Thermoplasmatota archaeon]|jgi:hypothetical protein|nr:hypothetical protein [Candidatus Thermoplasmatota archaeon]